MNKRGTISNRQVFFILTMLLTGIYILTLPRHMVALTGTDGWLALLGGGFISGCMLFFINKISLKFPNKTVVEFAPLVLGKGLGKGIGLILVVYFTLLAAVSLRIFTEMLKSVLLVETPRWIVVAALVILITWIVQNGIEDIARFTELIAPIIILFLFIALIGDFKYMEVVRIKPIFQSSKGALFKGLLSVLSYYGIIIILLMLYPYVNKPEKLNKTSLGALLFAVLITVAFFLGSIATFGIYETARMAWPVIELVKMVRLGEFLERVESIFLSVWLSIAFINISVLSFCSIAGWSQLAGRKNYRRVTYPFMIILLAVTLWPRDLLEVLGIYQLNFTYGFVISLLVPLFLWAVSRFYKERVTDVQR